MKTKHYYQQKKNSLLIFEIWFLKRFYFTASSEGLYAFCFCQILKAKLEQNLQWLLKQIHHPKMLVTGLLLRN